MKILVLDVHLATTLKLMVLALSVRVPLHGMWGQIAVYLVLTIALLVAVLILAPLVPPVTI